MNNIDLVIYPQCLKLPDGLPTTDHSVAWIVNRLRPSGLNIILDYNPVKEDDEYLISSREHLISPRDKRNATNLVETLLGQAKEMYVTKFFPSEDKFTINGYSRINKHMGSIK